MFRIFAFVTAAVLFVGLPLESGFATEIAPAFDVEQASRAYIDTLSGKELEKSNSYYEGGYWLILWGAVVGFLVDLIILQSRLSARFRDWAQRVTKRIWLQPAYTLCHIRSSAF